MEDYIQAQEAKEQSWGAHVETKYRVYGGDALWVSTEVGTKMARRLVVLPADDETAGHIWHHPRFFEPEHVPEPGTANDLTGVTLVNEQHAEYIIERPQPTSGPAFLTNLTG